MERNYFEMNFQDKLGEIENDSNKEEEGSSEEQNDKQRENL